MSTQFELDFYKFWNLINSDVNFAYSRYADGEVLLINGHEVTEGTQAYNIDKWKAPNKLTKVGIELLKTLKHTESNYFYAISGKNDNINDYNFLKSIITQPDTNITFANLWINSNYKKMFENYLNYSKPSYVICNEIAEIINFKINVIDIIKFPNDCINYWEINGDVYIDSLIKKYGSLTNQTFFISCGLVSEIIIDRLYNNNQNNKYIDVGSSMDEFIHNKKTRPYMLDNSPYSKQISSF